MKIWLDVLTPKQVLFFHPLAKELMRRGHNVLCTTRHYREVDSLTGLIGLDVHPIGKHGGASLYEKLLASSERIHGLSSLVYRWEPECAVSFGSPECARVSFGLKVPHICINDSPHAVSVACLTIPLSKVLMTPWIIPYSAWKYYGIERRQIIHYRALDPIVWLRRRINSGSLDHELMMDRSKKTVTIRLEESYASYLLISNKSWSSEILEELSLVLQDCNVVVLCRYEDQVSTLYQRYGSRFIIPRQAVDGVSLLHQTDVFVGMGGTMTAEAALLGIPTVSAYPGQSLYVERYLVKQGLLVKAKSVRFVAKAVRELLKERFSRRALRQKAQRLVNSMEDPVRRIIEVIEREEAEKA